MSDTFTEKDMNILKDQAFGELYYRSKSSSISYILLFCILAFLTEYYSKFPALIITTLLIIAVLTAIRMGAAFSAQKKYYSDPVKWKIFIRVITIISGTGWGLFTVLTFYLNGFTSPISVFNIILTCGLATGATTSLAPVGSIMRNFIIVSVSPIMVYSVYAGEYEYAMLFFIYTLLMSVIGRAAYKSYWQNIQNDLLLKKHEASIKKSVDEIYTNSGYLEKSSEQLLGLSAEVYDISSNMTGKSTNVASAAEKMSRNIISVSNATEETSNNMGIIASAVEEMSISIKDIAKRAGVALNVSGNGVTSVKNANDKMSELTTVADEIGNVTEIISDISEQTNLLALNATIEAARAGEAGKGFAVVANEIKALANQTSDATHKIKEQVSSIQNSVSESIGKIEEFSDIVNKIDLIIKEVAASVEEQSVTSNEISIKTEEISKSVSDISANMNESAEVTMEIANDISDVHSLAQDLSGKSRMIKDSSEKVLGNSNKLISLAEFMSGKKGA